MDRSFCGWAVFFSLLLAVLFAFGAWRAWTVYLSGTADPVDARLADVTPQGAGGNVHVRIKDMQFGVDYYPSLNKEGRWTSVVVPLLSGGQVRALLESEHATDLDQLQALQKQPVLTGLVSASPPYLLRTEDAGRFKARYPGVDPASLPVIAEGEDFPTAFRVGTLTAVSALGWVWAAFAGRLWWTSGRPRRVSAEEASPAARLRAAGWPLVEGLGELQEAYSAGSRKDKIFFTATLLVLFSGFGFGVLFGTDPSQFSPGWAVGVAVIELALVALFRLALLPTHMAALYDGGLATHYGRQTAACRWDEVESATGLLRIERVINISGESLTLCVPGPLRLCCAGGKTVAVGAVEGEMKLVEAVRHEVVRRQLPLALEALRKGEKVSAGPLELDRNGITGPGGCWVAWGRLGEVWSGDRLVIQENGLAAPLWSGKLNIPNAALLVELAEAAKRGEIR